MIIKNRQNLFSVFNHKCLQEIARHESPLLDGLQHIVDLSIKCHILA
jgi:hypothetical protein